MIVGYARTCTAEQRAGLDAQVRDLQAAGAGEVFAEQVSSMADRPKLKEALRFVRKRDTLMVCKPDRLARSVANLLAIVQDLDARGIALVILSMGGERLDTASPTGKLMLTMLTMLAAVAEFERGLMLERQREGIARAKAAGAYKGRQPTVPSIGRLGRLDARVGASAFDPAHRASALRDRPLGTRWWPAWATRAGLPGIATPLGVA